LDETTGGKVEGDEAEEEHVEDFGGSGARPPKVVPVKVK
jgi:hypothetical protein